VGAAEGVLGEGQTVLADPDHDLRQQQPAAVADLGVGEDEPGEHDRLAALGLAVALALLGGDPPPVLHVPPGDPRRGQPGVGEGVAVAAQQLRRQRG
jgi:hypothetical protein